MRDADGTRRYSLDELEAMAARGEHAPTRPDAPAVSLDEAFWRTAELVMPRRAPKVHTGLRIDADVLAWFKAQGAGYQSRMNAVLRAYVEAQGSRARER
jgi:uncharacterized protein (DUF4415 family)